jgi:hypothetical protein
MEETKISCTPYPFDYTLIICEMKVINWTKTYWATISVGLICGENFTQWKQPIGHFFSFLSFFSKWAPDTSTWRTGVQILTCFDLVATSVEKSHRKLALLHPFILWPPNKFYNPIFRLNLPVGSLAFQKITILQWFWKLRMCFPSNLGKSNQFFQQNQSIHFS